MRRILVRALRQAGQGAHPCIEAGDGVSALEVARRERLHLLLTECALPGLRGLDLLRTLRRRGDPVPVGFVTAASSSAMHESALAAGASFLLPKPVTAEVLREALAGQGPALVPAAGAKAVRAVPHQKALRDLFVGLLDRDVEVEVATRHLSPGPLDLVSAATYVDESLRTIAVVALDAPLSHAVAGAVGLLPPRAVVQALRHGHVSATVRDNLAAVLDVVGVVLNQPGCPHTRLHALHPVGEMPPTDVTAWLHAPGRRLDLVVRVPGYGGGRLAVVVT